MNKGVIINNWIQYCEELGIGHAKTRLFWHGFQYTQSAYELHIMGGMVRIIKNGYDKYEMTFFCGVTKTEILKQRNPESDSVLSFKLTESEYDKMKNAYSGKTLKKYNYGRVEI